MINDKDYYGKQHKFMCGVFENGKLVYSINKITCSHAVASIIIGILNIGKECLKPGHYFAVDFIKEK